METLEEFIKKHQRNKEKTSSFVEYLYQLMNKYGIDNPSDIYNKANISRQLWSSIISVKSHPSLNVCIKIALTMKINNHECKYLLKKAGYTEDTDDVESYSSYRSTFSSIYKKDSILVFVDSRTENTDTDNETYYLRLYVAYDEAYDKTKKASSWPSNVEQKMKDTFNNHVIPVLYLATANNLSEPTLSTYYNTLNIYGGKWDDQVVADTKADLTAAGYNVEDGDSSYYSPKFTATHTESDGSIFKISLKKSSNNQVEIDIYQIAAFDPTKYTDWEDSVKAQLNTALDGHTLPFIYMRTNKPSVRVSDSSVPYSIILTGKEWDDKVTTLAFNALKNDLGEDFSFDTEAINPRYNPLIPHFKVRYKYSSIKEKNRFTLPDHTDEKGLFVDVCLFMGVPIDKKEHLKLIRKSKLLMPIYVFLDAFLHINPKGIRNKLRRYEKEVAEKYKDSDYVSQTVIIPFQEYPKKFVEHLSFPKEVIYPFKEYDFLGKKIYSFNNLKEFCRLRYGEKALKKFDDKGNAIDPFLSKNKKSGHLKKINIFKKS